MEKNIAYPYYYTMDSFPSNSFPDGACITLGVFDAVHLGHQALLRSLINLSIKTSVPAIIFIISPNPKEILLDISIPTLTTLQERQNILLHYATAYAQNAIPVYCVHIPFTKALAQYSANNFIEHILMPFCTVKHIVIGKNAYFGSDKGQSLEKAPCPITYVESVYTDEDFISSTKIRQELSLGAVEKICTYLGRPFSIHGVVIHGCKRGSTLLGYPTANITLPPTAIPAQGVYAVYVLYKGEKYPAVMNIGMNPTFSGNSLTIEVHIINFTEMIYGEELEILCVALLRKEKKFANAQELIEQIRADITLANKYIS